MVFNLEKREMRKTGEIRSFHSRIWYS